MSHWPPKIVELSSTSDGALHVEWEIDSFFPDSEPPDEIWVVFGSYVYTLDKDAREIDIPSSALAPFAGTTAGGTVTFKWIGPPDDVQGSPFYVSVTSAGYAQPSTTPTTLLTPVVGLRASSYWDASMGCTVWQDWDAIDSRATHLLVLRDGPGGPISLISIVAQPGISLYNIDARELQPVSRYTYTVRSVDAAGQTADASVQVKTAAPRPAPPPSATWHGPEYMAYAPLARPAAVSWGPRRVDVFWYMPGLKKIVHRWQNNSPWSQVYLDLPPFDMIILGMAASTLGPNHLDLLYTRGDTVFHTWWNGSVWAPEDNFGITGLPAAISPGPGRIDVVHRTPSGRLGHLFFDAQTGWSTSTDIGGNAAGRPAIAASGGGLQMFYRSPANTLIYRWRVPPYDWSAEVDLGGALGGDPAAASPDVDEITVLYRNAAGQLSYRPWRRGRWYPEDVNFGDTIVGAPATSTWRGRIDVFYVCPEPVPVHQYMYHRWYD